jgi:DNA-binding MarR family transcriptional regulator
MTSEGRNALRHVTRVFRSAFDDVFLAGLTPSELEQMTELLRRLYMANLPGRQAETPPGPEAVTTI